MVIDGLAGKKVVVTGAYGQLGTAVTEAFLAADAHVGVLDMATGPHVPFQGPVAMAPGVNLIDPSSARQGIDLLADRLGGIDTLVNVAGGFTWIPFQDSALDDWTRLFAMNVQTAVNATKAALPHVKGSSAGRIISIGASAAIKAGAGMGPYAASKAGVMRFTEALAEEVKETGITVNAVLPSILDTPANRAEMPNTDPSIWVKTEDVADLILFLASDRAASITGALIPITGRV
ncbi:MAG: SDR family NAD(P)-dependent oxidoreductase [Alphaproteobacteria bacterium]